MKFLFLAVVACAACGAQSNSETAPTPVTSAGGNTTGTDVSSTSGSGGAGNPVSTVGTTGGSPGATSGGGAASSGAAGVGGNAGSGEVPDGGGFVDDARSLDAGDAAIDRGTPHPQDGSPLGDGGLSMTIEGLQVAGTHNSYHTAPLIAFDASHKYTQLPLDQQLAGGVRALELDLHLRSDGVFEIYHISIIDSGTTCATLDECLGVVATWSTAHPTHTPITIWFELKDDTGGDKITDIVPVEQVISKVFPQEKVMTPAWVRGSYASPHERITSAGWPTLKQSQGMVMFAIITRDARTQAYSHDFTSLDDRLIFVNPTSDQFSMPWAAITKEDDPTQSSVIAAAHAAHLLIDVNTCAVNLTDDQCQMLNTAAVTAGANMLQDDLPFPVQGRAYSLKLPQGSPGCNPVTAPPTCDPKTLE